MPYQLGTGGKRIQSAHNQFKFVVVPSIAVVRLAWLKCSKERVASEWLWRTDGAFCGSNDNSVGDNVSRRWKFFHMIHLKICYATVFLEYKYALTIHVRIPSYISLAGLCEGVRFLIHAFKRNLSPYARPYIGACHSHAEPHSHKPTATTHTYALPYSVSLLLLLSLSLSSFHRANRGKSLFHSESRTFSYWCK